MPWYLPDKYHEGLKHRVREYVKTRRDKFLLPTFWEWRVLEIFCDEIDRLQIVADKKEAEAGRIVNQWSAAASQSKHFYRVMPGFRPDEYDIIEYVKVLTTQDDAKDSIIWITNHSLQDYKNPLTLYPITGDWLHDNEVLLFETEATAKAYIRGEIREAAVEARKKAANFTKQEQDLRRKLKEYE